MEASTKKSSPRGLGYYTLQKISIYKEVPRGKTREGGALKAAQEAKCGAGSPEEGGLPH